MSGPRVRFAPSPTGSLHLGNARTALFNWLVARSRGGTLVLRLEDTDTERGRAGSEEGILEDLRWLGTDWDEGPDVGGPFGPYRQSERGPSYREAAERLLAAQVAYRCFCQAEEVPGGYPGTCRSLDPEEARDRAAGGAPHAVRLDVATAARNAASVSFEDALRGPIEFPVADLGDTVLVRRDGRPTYNFAVVADDGAMRIDEVIRGDDHLSNTPRQALLFDALGIPRPRFVHLPMVRGADGARLSKRHGAASLAEYRSRGYPAAGVRNALALLGWGPQDDATVLDLDGLLERFTIDRVGRAPAAFDPEKFDWICAQHVAAMDDDAFVREVRDRLAAAGLAPAATIDDEWGGLLAALARPGTACFEQIPGKLTPVFEDGPDEPGAEEVLRAPDGRAVAEALAGRLDEAPPTDREAWRRVAEEVKTRSGRKGGALFRPMRVAMTGRLHGPDLDRLVPAIVVGHRRLPDRVADAVTRVRRRLEALA